MKTFICILALAVASSKAGFDFGFPHHNFGLSTLASEGSSSGYHYAPPSGQAQQDFQPHGDYETHENVQDTPSHGDSHQYQSHSNNDGQSYHPQLNAQDFQHEKAFQSHGGHGGHDFAAALSHEGSAPSGHDFTAHFQPLKGLDYGAAFAGHGFSAPAHEAQSFDGSAHGQANHGQARGFDVSGLGDVSSYGASGHGGNSDSYLQAAEELHAAGGDDKGHQDQGQQGYHQGGHGQGIILQDISHEFGHEEENAEGNDEGGHGGYGSLSGHDEAVPVGEHTDVQHPAPFPQHKYVTVPVHKPIQVNVPKPILVGVPQPYPVKVPIHKPVAVPVETEINIPIEKVVPYPVVKHVPYPVEKHVPIKVEKTVTVHVPQPYPVKIPIYKTIHHHKDH